MNLGTPENSAIQKLFVIIIIITVFVWGLSSAIINSLVCRGWKEQNKTKYKTSDKK